MAQEESIALEDNLVKSQHDGNVEEFLHTSRSPLTPVLGGHHKMTLLRGEDQGGQTDKEKNEIKSILWNHLQVSSRRLALLVLLAVTIETLAIVMVAV